MPERRTEETDFDRLADLLPSAGTGQAQTPSTRESGGPGAAPDASKPGSDRSGASSRVVADADDLNQRLAAVWADVVGNEVAENARPVQLRNGRLVVTTSSSAWAQTLQLMSPTVMAGLNERLGDGSVQKAVFRHAGWDVFASLDGRPAPGGTGTLAAVGRPVRSGEPRERRERTPARPALPAAPTDACAPADRELFTAEQEQALADLERLPLTPSVKETIREAMKAGFARARQDSGRW